MKIIKLSFLSLITVAGLAWTSASVHASGCCASQAAVVPAEGPSTAVAPTSVNASVAEPSERGFFARLFGRFSSSRSCEVASKSDICPVAEKTHQAALIVNKDKDESKSGGCCPAQAASFQLALVGADCGDKADCGVKADCAAKACPAVANSCDKDADKKCCPAANSASVPLASAQ